MQVTYHTDSFLDKNRDYIVVEHCNLLTSSRCSFVSGLFPLLPEESSRSSYKFSSVATRFKVWESTTFHIVLVTRKCIIMIKLYRIYRWLKYFNISFMLLIIFGWGGGYCLFVFSATTSSTHGDPQVNRASLHTVREAKFIESTTNVWECKHHTSITLRG